MSPLFKSVTLFGILALLASNVYADKPSSTSNNGQPFISLTETVEKNVSEITENRAAIEANTASITQNSSAIQSNVDAIKKNTGLIANNASAITNNSGLITGNEKAIASLNATLETLASTAKSKEAELYSFADTMQTYLNQLDQYNSQLGGIQSQIDGIESDLTDFFQTVLESGESIDDAVLADVCTFVTEPVESLSAMRANINGIVDDSALLTAASSIVSSINMPIEFVVGASVLAIKSAQMSEVKQRSLETLVVINAAEQKYEWLQRWCKVQLLIIATPSRYNYVYQRAMLERTFRISGTKSDDYGPGVLRTLFSLLDIKDGEYIYIKITSDDLNNTGNYYHRELCTSNLAVANAIRNFSLSLEHDPGHLQDPQNVWIRELHYFGLDWQKAKWLDAVTYFEDEDQKLRLEPYNSAVHFLAIVNETSNEATGKADLSIGGRSDVDETFNYYNMLEIKVRSDRSEACGSTGAFPSY